MKYMAPSMPSQYGGNAKSIELPGDFSLSCLVNGRSAKQTRGAANAPICRCFISEGNLTGPQKRDLADGVAAVEAFWAAADSDPFWARPGESPLHRCILAGLSVHDILHEGGRTDAKVLRTGVDVRQLAGGPGHSITVGSPAAPHLERHWNAHLTVKLGTILLDPTHGQTKRFWNNSSLAAAFLIGNSGIERIKVGPGSPANVSTLHRYEEGDRLYQVAYFQLSRAVELRTRKWRSAPDARSERRRSLVRTATAIHQARLEHRMQAA